MKWHWITSQVFWYEYSSANKKMKFKNEVQGNKKAVIYCRVSTKEQVNDGNSLSTQEKNCRDYALKSSYDVACVFVEQGESAKSQDRTELQKLLTYCAQKKNGISIVIAYKIDRISRNTDDYSQIRILLKTYGVEIKSTSEFFENSPAGRFMENIIANVAQFDNDVRAERSVGGMKDATKEGRYVWMAPVGYDNIKMGGKSTIAPNKMAPLVKDAFIRVASNLYSVEEVYRLAISEGLVSRCGKPVAKSYFYPMLKNELYTGWIIKFGERHKGLFEPLISEELYGQVQRALKYGSRKNYRYLTENPDFPLRRFISHPNGLKLTGCWCQGRNGKFAYYRYLQKGYSFKKEIIETDFKAFLNRYSLKDELLDLFKIKIKENLVKEQKDNGKESKRLEQYISDLTAKQRLLIQKNLDGIINDQVLRREIDYIEKELFNAGAKLAQNPVSYFGIEDMFDFISEYLKSPGKIWAIAEHAEKTDLQWFDFPKGITFDGAIYQTTEICKLFKLNETFSCPLSIRVHSNKSVSNNPYITSSFRNRVNNRKQFSINNKKTETKEYWNQVANEINTLNGILKRINGYNDSS